MAIIEIPIKKNKPNLFQCENYLINDDHYWSEEGLFDSKDLINICDNPSKLWGPDNSSYYGSGDRVDECFISNIKDSLYLISPKNLTIKVKTEGKEFNNPRRKVRAKFVYNGIIYIFPVTDPLIEKSFLSKEDGDYNITNSKNQLYMCVSIGLPYEGFCYKFVASIIGI